LLDLFLSGLNSTVRKYPKILVHLFIAFLIALFLNHFGINIPQAVIIALHGKATPQLNLFMSLILAFSFFTAYLALVTRLANRFRNSMREALKKLNTDNAKTIVEQLKSQCVFSDLIGQISSNSKLKISGLSITLLFSSFSYHLMILHLVYFLDSLYNIMSSNSLIIALSSGPVFLCSLASLFLGAFSIAYYVMVSEQESSSDEKIQEEPLARLAEYLMWKYLIDNCVASMKEGRGLIIKVGMIALSPILPTWLRLVDLTPISDTVNYNIVKLRLEGAREGNAPYQLNGKNLDKCDEKPLTEKDFSNLLEHMCIAQIYEKYNNVREEIIGIMFYCRTRFIPTMKPALRDLSNHRGVVSTSSEEDYLVLFVLGVEPSIARFYVWLITGL